MICVCVFVFFDLLSVWQVLIVVNCTCVEYSRRTAGFVYKSGCCVCELFCISVIFSRFICVLSVGFDLAKENTKPEAIGCLG